MPVDPGPAPGSAVPIGIALVLFGFLVLATRRHAISQLVGFLMLDNGIAAVAFLTAGGRAARGRARARRSTSCSWC